MPTPKVLEERVAAAPSCAAPHPRLEHLTVRQVLLRRNGAALRSVSADASVLDALRVMAEDGCAALPVLAGGRLCGMISEHDYARLALDGGAPAATTPVRAAMSACDRSASPGDSVRACLERMRATGAYALVVEENGQLLGLLTRDELLHETVTHLERALKEHELDRQILFLRGAYSC